MDLKFQESGLTVRVAITRNWKHMSRARGIC